MGACDLSCSPYRMNKDESMNRREGPEVILPPDTVGARDGWIHSLLPGRPSLSTL